MLSASIVLYCTSELLFRVFIEGYTKFGRVFYNQRHFSDGFYSGAVLPQSRPQESKWSPCNAL